MKAISLFIAAIAAALCGFFFSGCASVGASDQESLLSAAGFVQRTPETAKQRELYAAAPAYRIQRAAIKGRVYYAYKDEAKGVAWVGDETAYQQYQQLAVQRQIAMDQVTAVEMSATMAWGWYGAYWGPYVPIRPIPPYPHPLPPGPHPGPGPWPGPGPHPGPFPGPRPIPHFRR